MRKLRLLEIIPLTMLIISMFSLQSLAASELIPTPTLVPALEVAQLGVKSNADCAPYAPYVQGINGMEKVLVPIGCFEMGEDGEGGRQCFDEPFWIGRYEVTNAQYRKCVDAGECTPPDDRTYYDDTAYAEHPVVYVDWFQANVYATWAGMRLPTEAEWEYVARGPDGLIYPWGNFFDGNLLNFCDANCEFTWRDLNFDDGYTRTAPVGTYPSGTSWVGAQDMSGNVREWVNSIYKYYPYKPDDERENNDDVSRSRVTRGGSWYEWEPDARAAVRYDGFPDFRNRLIGFRVLVDYS